MNEDEIDGFSAAVPILEGEIPDFEVGDVVEASTEAPRPEDQDLVVQVRLFLEDEIDLDTRRLHVFAKNGIVRLQGGVPTLEIKREIERQLRNRPGVRDVENNLTFDS